MLRILYIVPYCPAPPRHGGQSLIFHRLGALKEFAHVDLATPPPALPADRVTAEALLRPLCKTVYFGPHGPTMSPWRHRWNHVRGGLGRMPTAALEARQAGLIQAARTALSAGSYDVILVEHIYTAVLLESFLLGPGRPPVVLAEQNVEHVVAEHMAMDPHISFVRKWLWQRQAKTFRCMAVRLYPRLASVVHISSADADQLRPLCPAADIVVAPTRWSNMPKLKTNYTSSGVVSFFGTLGYFPNEEGLRWFCHEVWPRVQARQPDARLRIIGDAPPHLQQRLSALSGVELLGPKSHDEADRLLMESDVMISPIRYGSGIKMKNLVAMGMAMPVVATSQSLAGLMVTPGREVAQADDPTTFSSALIDLLSSESARRTMGQAARDRFDRDYTGPIPTRRWQDVLTRAADRNPPCNT